MNMSFGKHKDWTTTMREARTRSVPLNLPSNLKEYFKNSQKQHRSSSANSEAEERHRYHNPHGSSYRAENGRLRDRRREALVHVSRNNPHPFRIHFPFQTGDRLSTYMVWLPMDTAQVDNTPSLPNIHKHNPNQSRALPLGPTTKYHTSSNNKRESYENPTTPVSTYQAEISSMAVLRNRVMVDHFPDLTKRRSLIHAAY
ncbi:uncharacterized protein LOC116289586 [Actinia tenebrosa]|uniref:Uncharacterized protein LOC116289586 n=1 Tax=Actinia tenebrosa TaxID=6105 RepID=A0A6P8HIC8_ACTTE|nr:uncharacterized protein LOC116289586 [Actinia tenebrosa]